jgi:hypothetical protein
MFKRITYEEWAVLVVAVSFVLVTAVFLIGTIRAFCISKPKREHLESLPLDEPPPNPIPEPSTPITKHS